MNDNKDKALKLAIELLEGNVLVNGDKLSEIKRLAGVIEYPPAGSPCFVWATNRPKNPLIFYSNGDGTFTSSSDSIQSARFSNFEMIKISGSSLSDVKDNA